MTSFRMIIWLICLHVLTISGIQHQNVFGTLFSSSNSRVSTRDVTVKRRTPHWLKLRGGAASASEIIKSTTENKDPSASSTEDVNLTGNTTITVTTSVGSTFLDKIKRFSISRNASVLELKQSIRDKFPGNPPTQLQRIFYGFKLLSNHSQKVGELTPSPQIPILLDMLSGTSGYNKTMSITQALEAYVSAQVHQTYLSLATQKVFSSRDSITESELKSTTTASTSEQATAENGQMETLVLREIFDIMNKSVYEQYAEEIAVALEKEKEPEMIAADTIAWRRGSALSERSPLQSAWAKQFDTNKQVALALVYYSVILVIFSKYATSSKDSKTFLICMIPLLWVAKLRQFRVTFKLLINLLLQIAPYLDFVMPLLPAPYQAIANESKKWNWAASEEPILPRKKHQTSVTVEDPTSSNGDEEDIDDEDMADEDDEGDETGTEQARSTDSLESASIKVHDAKSSVISNDDEDIDDEDVEADGLDSVGEDDEGVDNNDDDVENGDGDEDDENDE